jgi:hypothetical protein
VDVTYIYSVGQPSFWSGSVGQSHEIGEECETLSIRNRPKKVARIFSSVPVDLYKIIDFLYYVVLVLLFIWVYLVLRRRRLL